MKNTKNHIITLYSHMTLTSEAHFFNCLMRGLLQQHLKTTKVRFHQTQPIQTHFYFLGQVGDLTWLCEVLVTPQTVVTTDNEPGG